MSTPLVQQIKADTDQLLRRSEHVATGRRGIITATTVQGSLIAIKQPRPDVDLPSVIRNEAKYNHVANKIDIGPTVYHVDDDVPALFRSYVTGIPFDDWIRYAVKNDHEIRPVLRDVFDKCVRLDRRGLHRPELSRPHKDILIGEDGPTIIDFERCRFSEHPSNTLQFVECLLRERYATLLGVTDRTAKKKRLRPLCRQYKEGDHAVARQIIPTVLNWTCPG